MNRCKKAYKNRAKMTATNQQWARRSEKMPCFKVFFDRGPLGSFREVYPAVRNGHRTCTRESLLATE
jgi:hypothetical protein